jgi:hypothetical protein
MDQNAFFELLTISPFCRMIGVSSGTEEQNDVILDLAS